MRAIRTTYSRPLVRLVSALELAVIACPLKYNAPSIQSGPIRDPRYHASSIEVSIVPLIVPSFNTRPEETKDV